MHILQYELLNLSMFRFSGGYGRKRSSVQVYDDVYDDDINGFNGFLRYVNIITFDFFANINLLASSIGRFLNEQG